MEDDDVGFVLELNVTSILHLGFISLFTHD